MRPQLIAHRGAPLERPENTLPAFLRALELGADAIELDVHSTIDGVVVVHHDPVPRARAPEARFEGRAIAALEWKELRRFVIGKDASIPTLGDVLDAVGDRADIYVEMKGRGIERAVVDTIRAAPAPARCALHSFDHRAVKRARALAPELRGGALLVSALVDPVGALRAADALDCWQQWDFVDRELVDAVHAAGGRVLAWTVNEPLVARSLAELGVDGLCSDSVPAIGAALSPDSATARR